MHSRSPWATRRSPGRPGPRALPFTCNPPDVVERLVTENEGFPYHLLRSFRYHPDHDDMIQDAFVGLTQAAQRFDLKAGYKFITYATWWVRKEIFAGGMRRETIHVPLLKRKALGRPAPVHSMDAPQNDNFSQEPYVKELAAPFVDPMHGRFHQDLRARVEELLSRLTPQERTAMELRFGLQPTPTNLRRERRRAGHELPVTLKQVGAVMGLSRERIRQLEETALRRMRKTHRITPGTVCGPLPAGSLPLPPKATAPAPGTSTTSKWHRNGQPCTCRPSGRRVPGGFHEATPEGFS